MKKMEMLNEQRGLILIWFLLTIASCSVDNEIEKGKEPINIVESSIAEPTPTTNPKEEVLITDSIIEISEKIIEKPKPSSKMVIQQAKYDYGVIMQGAIVRHEYSFKNTGEADLLITGVKASCGCTTPDYPKGVIPPGGNGIISVLFDSKGKLGRQNPHIDVFTNYQKKLTLRLEGFVDAEREKTAIQ